jgi:predicted nucleic acid-binding protein
MPALVVDASVALSWCFEDETTPWIHALFDRLRDGDQMIVPAHWPIEVLNGLLMATRRSRISRDKSSGLWDALAALPFHVEPPLNPQEAASVLALSDRSGLTIYDGAYLELAQRKGLPLATLDSALLAAAGRLGVRIVGEQ